MYHLRLTKGLSYFGAVNATAARPDVFTDDTEKYEAALKSGYFMAIQDAPAAIERDAPQGNEVSMKDAAAEEAEAASSEEAEDLSKMTVDKLRDYAKENGIALTGCSTKAEILQKIKEEEADRAAAGLILAGSGQ